MKINKLYAAVAASLVLAAASASAVTASLNDIVVSFSNFGATNVEVDVGQLQNYTAPGAYSLGNVSSYLSSAYTSSWASDSTLTFGAIGWTGTANVGSNGDPKSTVYASSAATLNSDGTTVSSVAPYTQGTVMGTSKLNAAGSKITSLDNAMGDATATVLASNAVSLPSSTGGSFDKSHVPGFFFTYFDDTVFEQAVTNRGVNGIAYLDLYKYSPGAGPVQVLTLALDISGNLYVVLPEPTSYAIVMGLAVLGLAAIRRRFTGELAA
jgi:hypothetical protein